MATPLDLLLAKRATINQQIVDYKTQLWELYLTDKVSVVTAVPTIFNAESQIQKLRQEYWDYRDSLGIAASDYNDCLRDEDDELENLRKTYIDKMNHNIQVMNTLYSQADYDPLLTDEQRATKQDEYHTTADMWRAKIKAVGGTPIENTLTDAQANATGKYWNAIENKYSGWNKNNITYDQLNYHPTQIGSQIYKYYKSFAGTDAIATIMLPGQKHIVLGEVTTMSYSIYRVKKPINTLGRISPKGFTKGPRIIAGSIIFTVTNTHWVNELIEECPDLFTNITKMKADELPPFDIMITYANEYGVSSYYVIYGATITEEGQVVSIEDALTENVCQFIARDIDVNSPTKVGNVEGKETLEPQDYNQLGVFNVNDLISDDVAGVSQSIKDAYINSLAKPDPPSAIAPNVIADVGGNGDETSNASSGDYNPNFVGPVSPVPMQNGYKPCVVYMTWGETGSQMLESFPYSGYFAFDDFEGQYGVTNDNMTDGSMTFQCPRSIDGVGLNYAHLYLSVCIYGQWMNFDFIADLSGDGAWTTTQSVDLVLAEYGNMDDEYFVTTSPMEHYDGLDQIACFAKIGDTALENIKIRFVYRLKRVKSFTYHSNHGYSRSELEGNDEENIEIHDASTWISLTNSDGYTNILRTIPVTIANDVNSGSYLEQYKNEMVPPTDVNSILRGIDTGADRYSGWWEQGSWDYEGYVTIVAVGSDGNDISNVLQYSHLKIESNPEWYLY